MRSSCGLAYLVKHGVPVLTVAVSIMVAGPSHAQARSWGKDVSLTCSSCFSNTGVGAKSLAMDQEGNAIAIFEQQDQRRNSSEIVTVRYTAETNTWSAPIRHASGRRTRDIGFGASQIGIDDAGNAFAVWRYGSDLFWIRFNRATNTWTRPKSVPVQEGHEFGDGQPLAVDGKGNAFLTGFNRVIRYDATTDNWCAPIQLEPEEIGNVNRVAVDRAGNAIVVWLGREGVKAFRFRIATGLWSRPQIIQHMGNSFVSPRIAMSKSGYGIVHWGQRGVGVAAVRYNPYTNVWGPVRYLEKAPSDQNDAIFDIQETQIAVDDAGNATAVWLRWDESFTNAIHRLSAARYNVRTDKWSVPRTMSAPLAFVESPHVAMDALGNAILIWNSSAPREGPMTHASRYVARTEQWQPTEVIQDGNAFPMFSTVAAGPNGSAIALWGEPIDQEQQRYALYADRLPAIRK